MKQALIAALMLGAAALAVAGRGAAGRSITQTIAGTRLDISATGEVTRVPDVAIISAGVVTTAATASAAIQAGGDADGAGSRGAEARRDRRPRHPDQQRQPQSRISLSREPAAAADRLYRLEPGQRPLPRHPQHRQDPRCAGRAKAPTRSTGRP